MFEVKLVDNLTFPEQCLQSEEMSLLPVERHFSSAASSFLSQKERLTGWFLLQLYPKTRVEMTLSHLSGSLKWQLPFFMQRKHCHCLLRFPSEMFSWSPLPLVQMIISHDCVNKKFCAFSDEKKSHKNKLAIKSWSHLELKEKARQTLIPAMLFHGDEE